MSKAEPYGELVRFWRNENLPGYFPFTAGVFAGWAFGLTDTLDLRVGAGAQYIHTTADGPMGELSTSTPFAAIDAVVGYRL